METIETKNKAILCCVQRRKQLKIGKIVSKSSFFRQVCSDQLISYNLKSIMFRTVSPSKNGSFILLSMAPYKIPKLTEKPINFFPIILQAAKLLSNQERN